MASSVAGPIVPSSRSGVTAPRRWRFLLSFLWTWRTSEWSFFPPRPTEPFKRSMSRLVLGRVGLSRLRLLGLLRLRISPLARRAAARVDADHRPGDRDPERVDAKEAAR